jgi:hypothetical protein
MVFAQLGVSVPLFWYGILLASLFAVTLGFPAVGRGEPLLSAAFLALSGSPRALLDSLAHLDLSRSRSRLEHRERLEPLRCARPSSRRSTRTSCAPLGPEGFGRAASSSLTRSETPSSPW